MANTVLMNAAYRAALGGTQAKGFGEQRTFIDFFGTALGSATEVATNHVKNRALEFNTAAEEAMNNSTGEMIDADWNMRYDQVMELKNDYIFGDKRRRAEIMREFEKLVVEQDNHDTTKIDIVAAALGQNGLNDNYKGTPQGSGLQGILNGNTPISYNETGEPGYILSNEDSIENFEIAKDTFLSANYLDLDAIEDWGLYDKDNEKGQEARGLIIDYYKTYMLAKEEKTREELDGMFGEKWYSMTDVKNIINHQSLDVASRDIVMGKLKEDKASSKAITHGEGTFPYDSAYEDTKNTIIGLETANLRSLGMDEILPGSGRTWFKDTQEALMNSTYEQLGIPFSEKEAKAMDPTPDTPITPQDARVITRAVMRDEGLYKDFLTSYYTKLREQNWYLGALERDNWSPPSDNQNPTIQANGGNIVNGVFVPNE